VSALRHFLKSSAWTHFSSFPLCFGMPKTMKADAPVEVEEQSMEVEIPAPKKKRERTAEPPVAEPATDEPTDRAERKKKRKQAEEAEPEVEASPPAEKKQKKKKEVEVVNPVEADAVASPEATEFRTKNQIRCMTGGELPDPVQTFDEAPFGKKLRGALKSAGFAAPTPIQAQAWPIAMQGSDLVACAKTGSGKTLAFLLPAFRQIVQQQPDVSNGPAALALAPTRELVVQIAEHAEKFGAVAGTTSTAIFGGVPKPPQAKALRACPHFIIATPGRLVDFMNDGEARLGGVQFLVLDEADRMLDMGFEPQMVLIMKQMKAERQTMLFSATWPKAVQKLANNYLKKDFVHINVGETEELAANKAVTQEFFKLDDDEKDSKLWRIMDTFGPSDKCIVFANTKNRIDKLAKAVWSSGYSCVAMHGDRTQKERDASLADFVNGKAPVMFATDVCARGLDIKGVTHVINYDMARDVESYIHRIGRTGRAGMSGTSITFVNHAYDTTCAPALAKIAKEAGQPVPEFLEKMVAKAAGSKNKLWTY